MSVESALVFLVPEAEALVQPFRERHDPSAARGMPAHVTLLFPFRPPDAIDASVLDGSMRSPGALRRRQKPCYRSARSRRRSR